MRPLRMDETVMRDSFHSLLERLAAALDLADREVFYQTCELRIGALTVGLRPAGDASPASPAPDGSHAASAAGSALDRSSGAADGKLAGVILHTHWPAPAAGVRAATHRLLLEANFLWVGTGGATLAVHPASGAIVMCMRVAPDIAPEALAGVLDRFASLAGMWSESCATLVREAGAVPETLRAADIALTSPGATWLIRG